MGRPAEMPDQFCDFLPEREAGAEAFPLTLKVYVAAIEAHHDAVVGRSLGKHDQVIRFLIGNMRSHSPHALMGPLCGLFWSTESSL